MNIPETFIIKAAQALNNNEWEEASVYCLFVIAFSMQKQISMDFCDAMIAIKEKK